MVHEATKETTVVEDADIMTLRHSASHVMAQAVTDLYPGVKLELIREIEGETITVYQEGDFVDLCRGPHGAREHPPR